MVFVICIEHVMFSFRFDFAMVWISIFLLLLLKLQDGMMIIVADKGLLGADDGSVMAR